MNYNLPNNVYYDANIINNDTTGTRSPPAIVFQDIRSTAILESPENYELSVVRFNLQTANSLPLWIPIIRIPEVGGFDPNFTIYSFHLVYKREGVEYGSGEVFVRYIPNDLSLSVPSNIKNTEDIYSTPYYYVKSFNSIVEMFNIALKTAHDQLIETLSYYELTSPSLNAPFFEWDSETSKFILNADVIGYDSTELDHISIFCNSPLYTLMSGFQGDYYGINVEKGKNYKFKIKKETRELNLFTVSDTYSVIQLYQEYNSSYLFNPISSIVFCSTMLPIQPSHSSKPTVYNSNGLVISGNNNNITSMITDFCSSSDAYPYSSSLSYIPSSEYRCISMNNGNQKITNIDLSIFWKDKYSHLHPLYLYPGCSCDIKILFRRI